MILFYCSDISERRLIHNYFRDRGVMIEAIPLSEFEAATYQINAMVALIKGDTPPGFVASFDPRLPVITVGKFPLGNSICFREYTDPKLLELLKSLSGDDDCFEYNDILFGRGEEIIYLGYPLKLTPTERALLAFLVKNRERAISAEELCEAVLGDVHLPASNISKHVSEVNRKAKLIGGRRMITSPARGYYKIGEYI